MEKIMAQMRIGRVTHADANVYTQVSAVLSIATPSPAESR